MIRDVYAQECQTVTFGWNYITITQYPWVPWKCNIERWIFYQQPIYENLTLKPILVYKISLDYRSHVRSSTFANTFTVVAIQLRVQAKSKCYSIGYQRNNVYPLSVTITGNWVDLWLRPSPVAIYLVPRGFSDDHANHIGTPLNTTCCFFYDNKCKRYLVGLAGTLHSQIDRMISRLSMM